MLTTRQASPCRTVQTEAVCPSAATTLLAVNSAFATGAPGVPATKPASRTYTATVSPAGCGADALAARASSAAPMVSCWVGGTPLRAKKWPTLSRTAGSWTALRARASSAAGSGAGAAAGASAAGAGASACAAGASASARPAVSRAPAAARRRLLSSVMVAPHAPIRYREWVHENVSLFT